MATTGPMETLENWPFLSLVRQAKLRSATSHDDMASHPPHIACSGPSDAQSAAHVERAIFTLLKPIKEPFNGSEIDIHGIEMRALDTPDLPLLDRYQGQPIALAQNVLAALCNVTVEQVRQLDLEDFAMLASDALFQVEHLSRGMGLRADFFIQPRSETEKA